MNKVVLDELIPRFERAFVPIELANIEGTVVRFVKIHGSYPAHTHLGRQEMFLVYRGNIAVQVGEEIIRLGQGETLTVPGNTKHCSFADEPAYVLVIESASIETHPV